MNMMGAYGCVRLEVLTFLDAAFSADVVTETSFVTTFAVEVSTTLLQAVTCVNQLRLPWALCIVDVRTTGAGYKI